MAHKYSYSKSSNNCTGQQVIDLQNLIGSSSEVVINVDSRTEIQVSVKKNQSKICTVVKKSSDNMRGAYNQESRQGMCSIMESMSEGSIDMASYQRKKMMQEKMRRQESCMDESMFGSSENRRGRMRDACDDPCRKREDRRSSGRDMYQNDYPESNRMQMRDPCERRSSRKDDSYKMGKKDLYSEKSHMNDPCMGKEKRDKRQSKITNFDERCERPKMDDGRNKNRDLYESKKRDPCAIPDEWLKKYPCLTKPKDPCGGTGKQASSKMDFSKMKEAPCKKQREDPSKMHSSKMREAPSKKQNEDPCKMDSSKMREGPSKRQKEDPCKKVDPCQDSSDKKSRSRVSKTEPSKSTRQSKPSAEFGRYESNHCSPSLQQASCFTFDPCKDPCAEDGT